jgi:putrescine transport system substrate-binding protein
MAITKLFRLCLASYMVLALPGCANEDASNVGDENEVNVYNWADYIGPNTVSAFEAEFGIKVNYDTYDSSEVIDVKMLTGNSGYDVVISSNQFASRLAPIGIYDPLDFSRLKNLSNLDPKLMQQLNKYKAVQEYNTPYHWGTTGYAWNAEMVRERLPDHPMDSADVIFDPEVVAKLADCGVTLLDAPTTVIPMVLAYLGRDPSAVDDENLAAAEEVLRSVRPYIRYFSNQKMGMDLPSKEVCVAMSWSGDYATAAKRAEEAGIDIDLRYTTPKEGSGLWVDGVYIPKDAPHKDNAYIFLDYLLRADVAAEIAIEVNYANANAASWPLLPTERLEDPAIYPDEEIWDRIYVLTPAPPKRERPRTRSFARAKSGI